MLYSNLALFPQAWARRTIRVNAIRPKYARAAMAGRLRQPKSTDLLDFFRRFWIGANAGSHRRRMTLRAPDESPRASSGELSSQSAKDALAVGSVSDRGWKVGFDADGYN